MVGVRETSPFPSRFQAAYTHRESLRGIRNQVLGSRRSQLVSGSPEVRSRNHGRRAAGCDHLVHMRMPSQPNAAHTQRHLISPLVRQVSKLHVAQAPSEPAPEPRVPTTVLNLFKLRRSALPSARFGSRLPSMQRSVFCRPFWLIVCPRT